MSDTSLQPYEKLIKFFEPPKTGVRCFFVVTNCARLIWEFPLLIQFVNFISGPF